MEPFIVDATTLDNRLVRVRAGFVGGVRHGTLYVDDTPSAFDAAFAEPEARMQRVRRMLDLVGALPDVLQEEALLYVDAAFAFAARCHELEVELATAKAERDLAMKREARVAFTRADGLLRVDNVGDVSLVVCQGEAAIIRLRPEDKYMILSENAVPAERPQPEEKV